MHILQVFIVSVTIFAAIANCDQPSYQVSLHVNLHPKGPPIHLCNGAIIQSRVIVTTAQCVYYKFSPNSAAVPLPPSALTVIAGSSTEFYDELTVGIKDVLIAKDFNYTTGENDLALLRLSKTLPLDVRADMSWITLDDAVNFEGPCVANYYIRNSISTVPNYIQTEELPLLDVKKCQSQNLYSQIRNYDICSLYMIPLGLSCQVSSTSHTYIFYIRFYIETSDNSSESYCSDGPINAFYTNLAPQLGWIFDVISDEDLKMYENGEFVSSLPYSGENGSIEEPNLTEPGTTSPLVGNNVTSTTESNDLSNAASSFIHASLTATVATCILAIQFMGYI
ncbi:trypsin [Musca vetustissima]|uniref:trypsin n=1 Tax=Musca vetustissima TaxID=27455 RepID=UPI002AB7BD73|nr:trypsin [Musca vetustissima]